MLAFNALIGEAEIQSILIYTILTEQANVPSAFEFHETLKSQSGTVQAKSS